MSQTTASGNEAPVVARRRHHTCSYKLKVLAQADRCTQQGKLVALARREELYASTLNRWKEWSRQENPIGTAGASNNLFNLGLDHLYDKWRGDRWAGYIFVKAELRRSSQKMKISFLRVLYATRHSLNLALVSWEKYKRDNRKSGLDTVAVLRNTVVHWCAALHIYA
ncbi:MAG: hypothetical protein LBN38_00660 [Verrucomicrobiota bacterium]|nr:hypothetical protein [Verrucomicrobiota bacterium]